MNIIEQTRKSDQEIMGERALTRAIIDSIDRTTPGGWQRKNSSFGNAMRTLCVVWGMLMLTLLLAAAVISVAGADEIVRAPL